MPEFNEEKFLSWYSSIAKLIGLEPDPDSINHQYDYRGYYKKYVMGTEALHILTISAQVNKKPGSASYGHIFTDEFKLPGHPTFSRESIYNDPTRGIIGGYWKNGTTFVPSEFNKKNTQKWIIKK